MMRLGIVSFGGNNALLVIDVVVHQKGWLSDEQMDEAIALSALAPGGSSSNLAYEVGRRIRGVPGGLTAYLSMAFPGIVLVLVFGNLILTYGNSALIRGSLEGAESAAVAMLLTLTMRLGSKALKDHQDWYLAATMLLCVGVLGWPLWFCLPVATAIGVGCRLRCSES